MCTRNLIRCCQSSDFDGLFHGTKQIFGMCETHGVANPYSLFRDYEEFITNFLRFGEMNDLVGNLHSMVWAPRQRVLSLVLGYGIAEWSSVLTRNVGACMK
jgi:hypothetical protein